jgi:hypothetical protein
MWLKASATVFVQRIKLWERDLSNYVEEAFTQIRFKYFIVKERKGDYQNA